MKQKPKKTKLEEITNELIYNLVPHHNGGFFYNIQRELPNCYQTVAIYNHGELTIYDKDYKGRIDSDGLVRLYTTYHPKTVNTPFQHSCSLVKVPESFLKDGKYLDYMEDPAQIAKYGKKKTYEPVDKGYPAKKRKKKGRRR